MMSHVTEWKCTNAVYHFDLRRRIHVNSVHSSKDVFFEPELFPAILISKWKPSHVTLFANGKGMITGVKSKLTALNIICEVSDHFSPLQ